MARSETQKLFAFFGSDLRGKGPEFLRQARSQGYTLLADEVVRSRQGQADLNRDLLTRFLPRSCIGDFVV